MSDLVSVRSGELNPGKSLTLAVLLTIVIAVLIFILARAILINEDFVGSSYESGVPRALAGFVFLAFPSIYQRLAGKRRTRFTHLPDEAVPYDAYLLPWYFLLTYGILIAFVMAGVGIFLIWLVGMATGIFVSRAISLLSLFLLLVAFYYLGVWIGSRSMGRPYRQAAAVVLGYTVLELLVSTVLNMDSPLRSPFGLAIFLILSLLVVLIGTSRGKRQRLLSYVAFLLKPLSEQGRQTVVENFYKDVKQKVSQEH